MEKTLHAAGHVINLYKKMREQRRDLWNETLSYAGRLDPMAEGVLLCLVGSANARREAYLDLNKEYILDVLFGFSTDTYDILGKVIEQR
jgi:tRNA pseudouridine55 synthase